MTNEQINQRIAYACGICGFNQHGPIYKTSEGYVMDCPNYCTDLNAMHEAEEKLNKDQFMRYCDLLWPLGSGVWMAIHATARQRAETFLLTLGKWSATDKNSLSVQEEVLGIYR